MNTITYDICIVMEYSQVVRHPFLVRRMKGSNPFTPVGKCNSTG